MVPALYTDGHEALKVLADLLGLSRLGRRYITALTYACTALMGGVTLLSVAALLAE